MPRILHTADIHLGKPFRRLKDGSERSKQLEEVFERICNLAIEREVDVLLIAGDLFDANRVPARLIAYVRDQFTRLGTKGIDVVLTAGTHDRYEEGCIYQKNPFEGVPRFFFAKPGEFEISLPHHELTICGASNIYNKSVESPLKALKPDQPQRYSVAMVHASFAIDGKHAPDDYPVTKEEIEASSFHYIAFGHWHRAQEIVKNKAWYSGAPEVLTLEDDGAGYVLMVDIDDEGTKIAKERVGRMECDTKDIEVPADGDGEKIKQEILSGAHPMLVRTAILRGVVHPQTFIDTQVLKADLEEHFFGLRIIDKTTIEIRDEDLAAFPDELVIGQFVRNMKKKIEAETSDYEKKCLTKALQMGVALLSDREVL